MLQIGFIRENKEDVIERLGVKHFANASAVIKQVLETDDRRRASQAKLENLQAESNSLAKQIGELFKTGNKEEAEKLRSKTLTLKDNSKSLEDELASMERELQHLLLTIPNLPSPKVPPGKTPEENENIFQHGDLPELAATAMPHWELASKYDIIDFELGNKITGAGFPVYKGKGAKLQRGLINFFLDEATKAGYQEVQPPIMVNEASAFGTGQLPDKEGQMYYVDADKLYLIPTAEVPITNIYRDVILREEQFPIKNAGYTPCFRREAGSYGAHVRGLNRLHQFDKVEIVQLSLPENSYDTLEDMQQYVQGLLRKLELPYRVLKLCGGDMSFGSALTYDMEVFSAAQKKWLEVSSVSNFESFQANRLKVRYKSKDGKNILAHTLNGSALALPRIVAALLENNQAEDHIRLPAVLHPYTGFDRIN